MLHVNGLRNFLRRCIERIGKRDLRKMVGLLSLLNTKIKSKRVDATYAKDFQRKIENYVQTTIIRQAKQENYFAPDVI